MANTTEGGALTAAELNRATLARQLLLERVESAPEDAVAQLAGLQGQAPASVYLALWNRLADLQPAAVDKLFASGTLVRATLMRMTLHVVHHADHPVFLQAMQGTLRARLRHERFRSSGVTTEQLDALLPQLLDHLARPRTVAELQTWLSTHFAETLTDTPANTPAGPLSGTADGTAGAGGRADTSDTADAERANEAVRGALWAARLVAPLLRTTDSAEPWYFRTAGSVSYVAATARPDPYDGAAGDEALGTLLLRYLRAFGPASVADAAQFLTVPRRQVRRVLTGLEDALTTRRGPGGEELFDVPDGELPDGELPAPPRLLGMWDNVLLAHADRSRFVPDEYRRVITRVNGDQLPTVLVDGRAAGVWRPTEQGVEVTAFHPLSDADWEGLAAESRRLRDFLADREPLVYRRWFHWWPKLPAGHVRILPGD
ncbi:winged helix DNA-binding domain-containing protein [Streptomyces sp. XM4193]|uniref:winged helix DNA-binding domain-containing protein n=1 Tax=Streptomyces sp. XM4193 TaxID=2929782 RepID=UPI001FF75F0F|nr:winged helix DNA-binding domain-containing protein [Streptomyces sp. XM4193]MCK1798394.1 winged helix DNA-binding domain-containing protein [Streptomyces sp. XM4193]